MAKKKLRQYDFREGLNNLIAFVQHVASDESACTCDEFSWIGKGHASQCLMDDDAVTNELVAAIREAEA